MRLKSGEQLKLSGWEVYTGGGTYSYKYYDWFKLIDTAAFPEANRALFQWIQQEMTLNRNGIYVCG